MQMKIISWKNRWMDRFRDNARPENSPFVDFTGTEEEINTRNLLCENFLLLAFRFLGNFTFEVKILFWIFHLLERFFSQVLRLFSDERDFLSGYSERDFLEFLSIFCRWKFFVSSAALHLKFPFFLYYQLFHTNTHTQCENFILEPRTLSWDEKGEFFFWLLATLPNRIIYLFFLFTFLNLRFRQAESQRWQSEKFTNFFE